MNLGRLPSSKAIDFVKRFTLVTERICSYIKVDLFDMERYSTTLSARLSKKHVFPSNDDFQKKERRKEGKGKGREEEISIFEMIIIGSRTLPL